MADIKLKRAYDTAAKKDGMRILVDRIWPRGVSKEDAAIDEWLKEIAPTSQLRKSFHDGDVSYEEFCKKYKQELQQGEQKQAFDRLKKIVDERDAAVTLVFAAKNEQENNAKYLHDALSN